MIRAYDDAEPHAAAFERVGIDCQGPIDVLVQEGLAEFEDSRRQPGRAVSDELRKAAEQSQAHPIR